MLELRRQSDFLALRIADLAVLALAFLAAFVGSGHYVQPDNLAEFFAVRVSLANFAFSFIFAVTWSAVFGAFRLYRPRPDVLITSEWWSIVKAVAVGTLLLVGGALALEMSAVNRVFVVTFFGVAVVLTIATRTGLRPILTARRRSQGLKKLVIVGCGPRGAEFGSAIRQRPELGYMLLGYIDDMEPPTNPIHGGREKILGNLDQACEVLATLAVDEVVIGLPLRSYYESALRVVAACEELGLTARVPAEVFTSRRSRTYVDYVRDQPMVTFGNRPPTGFFTVTKRVVDVLGALLALLVLTPVLAIIALAIRIDSSGPVLFSQHRVGLRRKMFRMLKFRTMRSDAEDLQDELENRNEVRGAAFKIKDDPRVTRVGRVLRKLSLDELPQLWNVLRGDMALVGPRPLPERDVERLSNAWQLRRFSVKPGLTCLWQINGRHEIDFEHWMELDLQYIDSCSLSLDFDILMKTLPAVLRGTGAS